MGYYTKWVSFWGVARILMLAASPMSANAAGGATSSVQDSEALTIADFFDGLRAWELKEEPTAAAIWLRAAGWGDVRSMAKIGELFERGEVLPHDLALAYFWFSQAAQRGVASARAAADRLRNQLPAGDLSEVDASVGGWQPRPLATAAAAEKKPNEPALVAGPKFRKKPDVVDLLAALDNRDIQTFLTVLSSGVSPSSLDPSGIPVIFLAVATKDVTFIHALLDLGADPNAKLPNGMTPLHIAAGLGSLEIVEILIAEARARGASAISQDLNGVTPLDLAERKKFGDVAAFLRRETPSATAPQRLPLAAPGLR